MRTFVARVIRYRAAVLLAVAVATVASGATVTRGVMASTLEKLFFGNSPLWHRAVELTEQFGAADEIIFIAWEEPNPLDTAALNRLRRLRDSIEAIPGIARVQSLLDVQRIRGVEGELVIENYASLAAASPTQAPELWAQLRREPQADGVLVAGDGRSISLLVELTDAANRSAESLPAVMDQLFAAFAQAGLPRESLSYAGVPAMIAGLIEESQRNIRELFPLTVVLLFVIGWVMFRRVWPVVITLVISSIAMVWTMGFAVLLDRQINIMITIVPIVMIVVGFSDVIHLCSAYLLELAGGHGKDEAIARSCGDVGAACFWTSATTFAGFASMSLTPAPVFRQMGLVLGFGVGVALLLALLLTPIAFSLMPQPRNLSWGTSTARTFWLDRWLVQARTMALRRPWAIIGITVFLIVGSGWCLQRLHIDKQISHSFSVDHPLRRGEEALSADFAGTHMVNLYVNTGVVGGILEPDTFAALETFAAQIATLPDVHKVLSVADVVASAQAALGTPVMPDDPPASRQALAQTLLTLEWSGAEGISHFVDADRSIARLVVHLKPCPVRRIAALVREAQARAAELFPGSVKIEANGMQYLLGDWLGPIVRGQVWGLVLAIVTIAVMMLIATRSLRVGLWSMAPNLIPLLLLGAAAALTMDPADSDLFLVAMIAIGIAVDDTIHFLLRYRIESSRAVTVEGAITNTFQFTGRALVITTVILAVGFAPLGTSDYFAVRIIGTWLPATLLTALLADLYLTPALVRLGAIPFPANPDSSR